ncbi:UbiA prenyltransferase family protein [Tenacibaculum caenipelagi]|uniref:4-hydroxybenzoate polyprenyltransferase n=1 Tax=Tenacibaculum caenipelagi TaxID=1325435 RepID=A0A4R6TFW9_9FLAO|nr:hypothetical protein [Tenacibaculum caenipelagi]TDQ25548.1 4-hydroxybenzoate polyprenyltransferase [Tenacibaculum caenipelagi]
MNNTFFSIIQWKKIVYFILILFLFKFCFLCGYSFKTTLSFFDLGLLSISSALLLASGYLISFFYRNQQKKSKISIPLEKVKINSSYLLILGVSVGFILSFKIHKPWYGLIFILCPIAVILYSKNNPIKNFFSGIITSFLKPFAVLSLWWFDFPTNLSPSQWNLFFKLQMVTMLYVLISFLGNISREIIVDIINTNEDNIHNQKTLPILLGRKRAKNIALALSIITWVLIFSIAITFIKNRFIFSTIILLGNIPQLYYIYLLINASDIKNYKFLYTVNQFIFLLALASIPVVGYYFKHVIE